MAWYDKGTVSIIHWASCEEVHDRTLHQDGRTTCHTVRAYHCVV
ncbi:unnamed protein product [Spirodela intermedia]|uniref:Uncharacterized protein n=1 Tax=Spirodela intermedia TaxID=51605 RepID=A0A7I8JSN1_SPIIN|nr:unnamed protein product [Spirodela intermedia]CAA6673186.1 unnamed protein product [Spirodela intermedia]